MSIFGDKEYYNEKKIRSSIKWMKFRVTIGLYFFKKIEIEKERRENNYIMEKELEQWSSLKGIKFSIKEIELPRYIIGHEVYLSQDTRHCTIFSFSK